MEFSRAAEGRGLVFVVTCMVRRDLSVREPRCATRARLVAFAVLLTSSSPSGIAYGLTQLVNGSSARVGLLLLAEPRAAVLPKRGTREGDLAFSAGLMLLPWW